MYLKGAISILHTAAESVRWWAGHVYFMLLQALCAIRLRSLQLSTHDFAKVQEALWQARAKWYHIGIRLNLGVFELDCIDAEPGFGLEEKFNLMIKTRLKKSEPCTWRELYDALNHPTVDMASVADRLQAKSGCAYLK